MPIPLNQDGYQELVDGDLEWLLKQPRTLEREHIEIVLRNSVATNYGPWRKVGRMSTAFQKEVARALRLTFPLARERTKYLDDQQPEDTKP